VGGRYKPCIGGEFVGALEGGKVSCGNQELRSEDYSNPRQTSEDLRLRMGEKTLLKFPVKSLDSLFEGKGLSSKLGDDPSGDLFGRESDTLGLGRSKGLCSQSVGPLDAAVCQEVGDGSWRPACGPRVEAVQGSGSERPGLEGLGG
jgi:hypothetical protein